MVFAGGAVYRNDRPFDGRPPAACNELLLTHPQGRGTLRRVERAIAMTSAIPPPRTSLLIAVGTPALCLPGVFGGKASARGSVTRSTSAGPGCANASRRAARTSVGFSIRTA